KRKHRARWRQGLRKPALAAWPAEGVTGSSPNLRLVLEYRLCGVKDDVVRGVAAWQAGLPVTLLTSVPTPRTLLGLQARGARCVSLLPAGAATEPHADALEFLLH